MNTAKHGRTARSHPRTAAATWLVLLMLAAVPASAATIDDFSTAQTQLTAPPRQSSNVPGGMIGGRRDLDVEGIAGPGPVTVEVTGGQLLFSVPDTTPDSRGRTTATWDGGTDPDSLDPTGLGGEDLTAGGHTGFRLTIDAAGVGSEVVIEVWTDGGNASKAALVLPLVTVATDFDISFSTFAASLGTGADFADVGAITMRVASEEQAVDLASLVTVGPAIILGDALKTDVLIIDNDGDGLADPGDTLRYTITITNTGAEATSVNLGDTIGANLAAVPNSLFTEPIAAPDTYIACGNITLVVDGSPSLPGLTVNDHDPDGESFSITTAFPLTTDQGGTVDNVDTGTGSFDYVPPAGFRGVDTFTYVIEDDGGRTNVATATLMVDSLVWFVDNTVAGGGSGQQASPFNNLGDVQAASGPGDTIFVFAGSGDTGDGIVLQDRQKLIGEGVGLTACGTQVIPPGSRPTLVNSSSTVVTLAGANRIAGLNIEPEGSEDAIVGSAFDGLEVEQVGIDTSRSGPANGGVRLSTPTGTMSFAQLSVTGTGTGTAFTVTGGDPQITVTASSLTPTGGRLLSIAGTTGGFIDFQASNTMSLAGGAGDAVSLQTNAAIISIASMGGLTTTGGGGLLIGNNGAVNLGTLSAVTATGGPALDITGSTITKIGGGALSFSSLSSTTSGGVGVRLSGVASDLSVSGSTTVTGSTGDGIHLVGSNGALTFTSVTVDATNGAGLYISGNTTPVSVAGGSIGGTTPPTSDAVDIFGGSGDITIAATVTGSAGVHSVDISNRTGGLVSISGAVTDPGIGINLSSNTGASFTFTGALDLDTGTHAAFNATGGGTVNATGSGSTIDTTTGAAVNIVNTDIGTSGLTFQSVSSNGAGSGIVLNNTGTAGGLTVTGVGTTVGSGGTIQGAADAVSLTNTSKVTLDNMILTNNTDSAITGSNVTDLVLDNVDVSASGNAVGENSVDLTNLRGLANAFSNSIFTASTTAERAVRVSNTIGTGTADVLTITDSTFQDTFSSPVGADLLEMNLGGTARLSATITGSTFDDGRTNGIQMLVDGTATGVLNVSSCTLTDQGIGIDMGVTGSGSLTFDISGNPDITARPGYGTTMVNLFTDDTATATGRVNNNPNIGSGGTGFSGFGIRFNINGSSNAVVEAVNNTIGNIGWDIGIDAVARGGNGRLDATITNNNVTLVDPFGLYDIRTQAQDSNTVCANVASNTASGVAIAAYRERTSAAGSTVLLQGFNTNATTTWNNNGNTPAGSVSSSNNGTLGGATCNTVP